MIKTTTNALAASVLSLLLATPDAHAVLSVSEPWVRAAKDGRSAELFMKLTSSDAAALAAVDTFAARSSTIRVDGMTPGPAQQLPLPAGITVQLAPQASRVALTGLTRRLKPGEYVPVTLIVRTAEGREQKIYINAEVRQHSPTEDEMDPHSHGAHKHGG